MARGRRAKTKDPWAELISSEAPAELTPEDIERKARGAPMRNEDPRIKARREELRPELEAARRARQVGYDPRRDRPGATTKGALPLGRPRFLTENRAVREPTHMLTFKLPVSLMERLRAKSRELNTPISVLVREALMTALEDV